MILTALIIAGVILAIALVWWVTATDAAWEVQDWDYMPNCHCLNCQTLREQMIAASNNAGNEGGE